MNYTVKQIITNPIYLGHLVQMRTTTVSYKNKKTVKRDPEDIHYDECLRSLYKRGEAYFRKTTR